MQTDFFFFRVAIEPIKDFVSKIFMYASAEYKIQCSIDTVFLSCKPSQFLSEIFWHSSQLISRCGLIGHRLHCGRSQIGLVKEKVMVLDVGWVWSVAPKLACKVQPKKYFLKSQTREKRQLMPAKNGARKQNGKECINYSSLWSCSHENKIHFQALILLLNILFYHVFWK